MFPTGAGRWSHSLSVKHSKHRKVLEGANRLGRTTPLSRDALSLNRTYDSVQKRCRLPQSGIATALHDASARRRLFRFIVPMHSWVLRLVFDTAALRVLKKIVDLIYDLVYRILSL
jgi:hypothetical protein